MTPARLAMRRRLVLAITIESGSRCCSREHYSCVHYRTREDYGYAPRPGFCRLFQVALDQHLGRPLRDAQCLRAEVKSE